MDSNQTRVTVANAALRKLGSEPITALSDSAKSADVLNGVYNQLRDWALAQHPWTFAKKTVQLTPLAVLWVTNKSYAIGDYAIVSGVVYKCLVAHTSGTFATDLSAADWSAHDWVTATSYALGDFVNHGGSIYACLYPHTSGTFATDLSSGFWVLQSNVTVSLIDFGDGVNLAYAYPSDWVKPNLWKFASAIKRLEKAAIFSDTPGMVVKYTYANDDPTTYSPEFIEFFATKLAAETCYAITSNAALKVALMNEVEDKREQAISADSQGDTPDQIIQDEWEVARLDGSIPLPGQVSFFNPGPTG